MKKPKLTCELVPRTCFYSNVRSVLPTSVWDKLRKESYAKAKFKCEICKGSGLDQGYKHALECHEIWDYDDLNHVQTLTGLISLCPTCHQVKHIGRSIAIGKQDVCFQQLAKVNKWTQKEIEEHISSSFQLHKERSKYQWSLDLSLLTTEPYNIVLKKTKERIFEVKKYKKKKVSKKEASNFLKNFSKEKK